MIDPTKRFMNKIIQLENGCWLWNASKGKSGYGHFWFDGKFFDAHKFSYMWFKGHIPSGKLVLHECDNKLCVNPDHLKLGTQHDNLVDWHTRHPHPISPLCTFKGRKHNQESRNKISSKAIGNTYCKGRPLSARTKRDQYGRFVKLGKGE